MVREHGGELQLVVIRPRGKTVLALPKGHVNPEEKAEDAARREVLEETGIHARLDRHLGDIRYFYQFRGRRIFKTVSFFLFWYESGTVDDLDPSMRVEVDQAKWIPLVHAHRVIAYRGEKDMVIKAQSILGVSAKPKSSTST